MSDKSYKNFFDDGVTTYHDDGTKSVTYKNFFNDGTTTYHSNGTVSKTYNNFFSDGTTTYHSDGSKSRTYKNFFTDGYTTYHSDGSKSKTYKDIFGPGYTTYHEKRRNSYNNVPVSIPVSPVQHNTSVTWNRQTSQKAQKVKAYNFKYLKLAAVFLLVPFAYAVAIIFVDFLPKGFIFIFSMMLLSIMLNSFCNSAGKACILGLLAALYHMGLFCLFQMFLNYTWETAHSGILDRIGQRNILCFVIISFLSAWVVGSIAGKIFLKAEGKKQKKPVKSK